MWVGVGGCVGGCGQYMHAAPADELAWARQGAHAVAAGRIASVPAEHIVHACDTKGSYLRLLDIVYHSSLGLRVIKKEKV